MCLADSFVNIADRQSACSDAGSSKEVRGNPTEYFRRAGSGTSKGVGIKLGAVRAEWATDGKAGSLFMRYGERF